MLNIGIDWDDVIAPFNQVAIDLANEEHGTDIQLSDIKSWGRQSGKASIVADYYTDNRVFLRQVVSDEAKAFVRNLQKKANVYIITAVPPKFMGIRAEQIKEAFPDFPDSNIILGSDKSIVRFDVTLDDGPHNILKSGARFPVLFRQPWNYHLSGLLSVTNYDEFLAMVEQIKLSMVEDRVTPVVPSLIALVGPSGSRKNELTETLISCMPKRFERVKSYTTGRGDDYHIPLSKTAFDKLPLVTKTVYAGEHYGTSYDTVKSVLDCGVYPIIPLDICGAISLKRVFPTVIVFCKTSREAMIDDILKKNISIEEKKYRLLSMEKELDNAQLCDIVVRTEDVKAAAQTIINSL